MRACLVATPCGPSTSPLTLDNAGVTARSVCRALGAGSLGVCRHQKVAHFTGDMAFAALFEDADRSLLHRTR